MALTTAQKSARYRAKDVDAYRKAKRELAKTPAHRKVRAAYMRAWRSKNRKRYNAYARVKNAQRLRRRHPDDRHAEHIKRVYGLAREKYLGMSRSQKGRCAICKTDKPGGPSGRLVVDHCHKGGQVRGLLCNWCNAKLGWYEENAKSVAKYLLKHAGSKITKRGTR